MALFGGSRVKDLGAWPLLVAEPPGSRPTTFDPGAVWTLMAGGDVMLDRTVYKRAIREGRGVDYPWNGGLARITARVLLWLARHADHPGGADRARRCRADADPACGRRRREPRGPGARRSRVPPVRPGLHHGSEAAGRRAARRHRRGVAGQQPHPQRRSFRRAPDAPQPGQGRAQALRGRSRPRGGSPARVVHGRRERGSPSWATTGSGGPRTPRPRAPGRRRCRSRSCAPTSGPRAGPGPTSSR